MSTERDATRIVQSWLEAGSTAIPDRVLDAVLAELPSRPQRRSRWTSWRTLQMKPFIPIAVGAAAILIAIVLGTRFLPSESNVGGPSPSPEPSTTSQEVGGHFVFGDDWPVDVDASSDGTSLSGTVLGDYYGNDMAIELQCLRRYDDATWMLAGELTESADPNVPDGSWAVLIVRDGSPQQAGVQTKPHGLAADCEDFVRNIPNSAVEGPDMIGDMSEGSITLPPTPPGNVSGQVGFVLGDDPGTLDVDAMADGSSLSGTAKVSFGDFQEVPELEDMFEIELKCARQFDDTTTLLAGTIDASTHVGLSAGTSTAIILRDGSPQELVFWFDDAAPADDCAGFVNGIADEDIVNGGFVPVSGGEISLP